MRSDEGATMTERVWDRYLTEQDKAYIAANPAPRKGVGTRPALLLVDLYRWVFGDRPEPLMDAIKDWPASCGLAGWAALPHIQRLLLAARANGIPVIHVTGLEGMAGWRDATPRGGPVAETPESIERRSRKYDIVEELAPIDGETVLHKTSPSVFWGTPIVGLLNSLNVDTLVVAGESTSGCCRASVVDGKAYRYKMLIAEECVFDRTEATHAINLFDLDQKYADVVPIDEAIAYLKSVEGWPRKRS
jgi:maleamate amidohydrolase